MKKIIKLPTFSLQSFEITKNDTLVWKAVAIVMIFFSSLFTDINKF